MEESGAAEDVKPKFLWLAGFLGLGLIGFGIILFVGGGWPDTRVSGLVLAAGGTLLLPPLLRRIRAKAPWARRKRALLMFVLILPVVAAVVGQPFAPSATERAELKVEAIVRAERLLKEGKATAASSALRRFEEDRTSDPALANLFSRIEQAEKETLDRRAVEKTAAKAAEEAEEGRQVAARQTAPAPAVREEGPPDPAEVYVERVETYWLPEVKSLPTGAPADMAQYNALLTKLDGLRSNLADGQRLNLTPQQKAVHSRFAAALSAKQVSLFPVLRRRYAELLGDQLFRHDVRVTATGPGFRILRLTAPMFVRNANIEDMQNGLASNLRPARYGRVEYRWSPRASEWTSYDLKPLSDGDVISR